MPATLDQPKTEKAKFKLLRGMHVQAEETGRECSQCKQGSLQGGFNCPSCKGTGRETINKTYEARKPGNDIVESSLNLQALFGFEKFQSLDSLSANFGGGALLEEIEALKAKNAELERQLSASEEVDVSAMKKVDLVKFASDFDPPIDLSTCSNDSERRAVIQNALDAM